MAALIILAAGESRRLGRPKQNLLFHGQTLLQRAIETALATACRPVFVVLGANADGIKLTGSAEVKMLYNKDWEEGLGSSIRIAIREIENDQEIDQAILMLCDQPFVTPRLIGDLLKKQEATSKPIIACSYCDTVGVPVLFARSLFAELRSLQGGEGAKKLLQANTQYIARIPFEQGSIDIDTEADYELLIKQSKANSPQTPQKPSQ
jgi:molybdenum cofactor cytidylyltransferase